MTMKTVFTDSKIIDRGDIDWTGIEESGRFLNFSDLSRDEAKEVLKDAEAVFVDGFAMDREMIEAAPDLRFIGAAATGFDNIDIAFAQERGIAVCNVPAYSTEAVAQHAIALMLSLAGNITAYDRQVKEGLWSMEKGPAYEVLPVTLLQGRTFGVIGYGNIGKRASETAKALGMKVKVYSRDPQETVKSDVLSLHCPLTDDNSEMIDEEFIENMKDGAILINTARGGLVDSRAVAEALKSGKLAGYGADVTSPEPPTVSDPLLHAPNCIITPHIAFTPREIRQRVVDVCGENLAAFISGEMKNRIV